jgi:hypothetical protein
LSEAARLPAHIEVAGLIRSVQAQGGFAAVLKRGDEDGGSILLVLTENGTNTRLFERMPQLDGSRKWLFTRAQDPDNPNEFTEYLDRRGNQDRDLWIVELDIAEGERLIG